MGVERAQLASLLLVMFVLVAAPVMAATILKAFFYAELRSRLHGNTRSKVGGVRGCQPWGACSEDPCYFFFSPLLYYVCTKFKFRSLNVGKIVYTPSLVGGRGSLG